MIFLAIFSIGVKFFEIKSLMSYLALIIGILLFLASTVSKEVPLVGKRDEAYKEGTNTNVNNGGKPDDDIKAFANKEDLKIEKPSDSLKDSKNKLEMELEGVRNNGQDNEMAAPVF